MVLRFLSNNFIFYRSTNFILPIIFWISFENDAEHRFIVDLVRDALDETPPELISDLMETGICLAGGGALLKGLAERISEETHIRAWVAQDPLTCVARGAGMVLENFDALRATLSSDDNWRPGGSASW